MMAKQYTRTKNPEGPYSKDLQSNKKACKRKDGGPIGFHSPSDLLQHLLFRYCLRITAMACYCSADVVH